MKTLRSITSILVIISCLVSCAELNSIYRQNEIDENIKIITVDAKQRFVFANKHSVSRQNSDGSQTVINGFTCSEPSPDVFSVYAAALEADSSKADLLMKLSTSENGATIGLRTEVIQLMRDAMYRLCEAYAAGGLTPNEYKDQLARYQKSMVTLIAVSQLTNAAAPPAITLLTSSSMSNSNKIIDTKQDLDNARIALKTARLAQESATKSMNDAKLVFKEENPELVCKTPKEADKVNCTAFANAKKIKEEADAEVKVHETNVVEWEAILENSKLATALSASGGARIDSGENKGLDEKSIVALATEIRKMVSSVYQDDIIQTCLDISKPYLQNHDLVKASNKNDIEGRILKTCEKYFESLQK